MVAGFWIMTDLAYVPATSELALVQLVWVEIGGRVWFMISALVGLTVSVAFISQITKLGLLQPLPAVFFNLTPSSSSRSHLLLIHQLPYHFFSNCLNQGCY